MRRVLAAATLMLAPLTAAAQEDGPRFCPNRPDLGTSTCTTDVGRVLVELSVLDWQRDRQGGGQSDSFLAGDALVRTGLDRRTEVQIGWTPVSRLRERGGDGSLSDGVGVGDVRLGLRRNLRRPDGGGFSFAVEPFVTLPTGTGPAGRGDWSAGIVVPVAYELGDWSLAFTGEVDAATDQDRTGRHAAYAANAGIGRDLCRNLAAVVEIAVRRDDDPEDAHTEWVTAVSLAWQVGPTTQLDLLATAGINRDAPDLRLAVGGAVLF